MLNFLSGRKFRQLNPVIKEILVYHLSKKFIFAAIKRFFMITLRKSLTIVILLTAVLVSSLTVFAQEATPKNNKANRASKLIQEKAGRPDIPGDLMIEFGFNWIQEHPEGIGFNTVGSRTFNAYYQYEMNIGESAFSFHPGIGIGTDKYKFSDNLTLGYGLDSLGEQEVQLVSLDSIFGTGVAIKKSQINASYIDIPLEIRWISRKYDPKRSLKIAIGGKVGFLIDSKTKIKYTEDSESKIVKQKENFELSQLRYGAYMKLGFGGFSAFGYYSLSDTFKKDKGPMDTTMYPFTFGFSLALF
jgi:hypothetical protein